MTDRYSHCLMSSAFKKGLKILTQGNSYRFGRSSDAEIHISSSGVSRLHARVFWSTEEKCWLVEDLGSRNGTRVGDQPVKAPTALSDSDLIVIGPFDFRYRRYRGDMGSLMDELGGELNETTTFDFQAIMAGISGEFADRELSEFCQFIAFNEKSGLLKVQGVIEKDLGRIVFEDGQIAYAEDQDGEGIDAAKRLLSMGAGAFEFRNMAPPDLLAKMMDTPYQTNILLMDLARAADEEAADEETVTEDATNPNPGLGLTAEVDFNPAETKADETGSE